MKWENLKENKCPTCSSRLRTAGGYEGQGVLKCDECGFMCRERRARQILENMDSTKEMKSLDQLADEFLKKHNRYIPKY